MSLEASDIRLSSNSTLSRFLQECGESSTELGLSLETHNSGCDANNNFLSTGTPDTAFKTSSSDAPVQHPWSDMVTDDAYMSLRQMSPGISHPSSSSSMLLSLPLYTSSSSLESTSAIFQELNPVFLKPSVPKPYHIDLETSSVGSDSPTLVSFVSSGVVWRDSVMAFISQDIICSASGLTYARDHPQDKDMSDHKVGTDMDSDESNYEGETLQELYSIRSGIATSARTVWTRALVQSVSKATATGRTISSKTPRSRMTNTRKAALAPRKSKSTVKSTATATTANGSLSSPKHDSPGENEESSATKRTQFLKRNRVAAFKCREKKRRQTLTTVTDADIIMARNQALYETYDKLQEEARMLKDQILCHRGCSCDAIQKFVQSSFGSGSFMRGTQAPRTMSILQDPLGYRF